MERFPEAETVLVGLARMKLGSMGQSSDAMQKMLPWIKQGLFLWLDFVNRMKAEIEIRRDVYVDLTEEHWLLGYGLGSKFDITLKQGLEDSRLVVFQSVFSVIEDTTRKRLNLPKIGYFQGFYSTEGIKVIFIAEVWPHIG